MMKRINPQQHPAYKRFLAFSKDYPNIKAEYKKFDSWYFANKARSTPDGVYVPSSVLAKDNDYIINNFSNEILNIKHGNKLPEDMNPSELRAMRFINGFKMFLAWRMSLSIYKIDSDIFEEMLKAPIPTDTPAEVFKTIPDFCVYVEFPRLLKMREINPYLSAENDLQIKGFWAYLNYPISGEATDKMELYFCSDIIADEKYDDSLSSVSMIIDNGLTVEQSADLVFEQYTGMSESQARLMAESDKLALYAYLPMLLWLCAEKPDISNMVGEPLNIDQVRQPKYLQKKRTGQFVPPSTPRIYHLGKRLGGEIRKFKDAISESDSKNKGKSKRPHIRKGHWHGYWTGTGQNKKFIIKWLPATFVNAHGQ